MNIVIDTRPEHKTPAQTGYFNIKIEINSAAVDRLTSTAHELVIEGQSYRRRQKPTVDT